jgi:hypothetical protein
MIEQQREEITWLRLRVDQLTPLALPKPRKWLAWLFPIALPTGEVCQGDRIAVSLDQGLPARADILKSSLL